MQSWQQYSHCDINDMHCWQDIWPKLCKPEQNKALHEALQVQHTEAMKHFEQGCAIVPLLMAQMMEAACDDPGAVLLPQLMLPLLRERLEAKAKVHKVFKDCFHIPHVVSNNSTYPTSICMPYIPYRDEPHILTPA